MSSQKVLCLGSNCQDTDQRASDLAAELGLVNHGLLTDINTPLSPGVYHTTVLDISQGAIVQKIANRFDRIIMLDQPRDLYQHWKVLQSTYKVMTHLESLGHQTQFRHNANVQRLQRMEQLVNENPAWCIYPWINFVGRNNQGLNLCARSDTLISDQPTVASWRHSTVRQQIKDRMVAGDRLPEHCSSCYRYEDLGIESYRQYESRDWLNQLDVDSLPQLQSIETPLYYEVHFGNLCNLKCRGCDPDRSSAIDREYKKFDIKVPSALGAKQAYVPVDAVDISSLTDISRVYISGGEPLIMPETVEFMQRCLDAGRMGFELTMSVNGVKIPRRFVELSRHFTNLNLSFSLDGYREVNDYWRTGANWDAIVANMHAMQDLGHNITVNTVPGIYNVTNLHLLFQWLDKEFPGTSVYVQISHTPSQSAYNHPRADLAIESMRMCQNTQVYWADAKSLKTAIDSLLEHYQSNPKINLQDLRDFFQFNDRLDQIRGTRLGDVIPELEACRRLLG